MPPRTNAERSRAPFTAKRTSYVSFPMHSIYDKFAMPCSKLKETTILRGNNHHNGPGGVESKCPLCNLKAIHRRIGSSTTFKASLTKMVRFFHRTSVFAISSLSYRAKLLHYHSNPVSVSRRSRGLPGIPQQEPRKILRMLRLRVSRLSGSTCHHWLMTCLLKRG